MPLENLRVYPILGNKINCGSECPAIFIWCHLGTRSILDDSVDGKPECMSIVLYKKHLLWLMDSFSLFVVIGEFAEIMIQHVALYAITVQEGHDLQDRFSRPKPLSWSKSHDIC